MDNIRQLKTKKSTFGGYDRESVMNTIQEICNNYEKHISKIFADNKDHFDMLNAEISDLRQKNEMLSRRATTDPAVINRANQAIAEANSRIEAANESIAKLQTLYELAETKLKEQEELISKLSLELKENASKKAEDISVSKTIPAPQFVTAVQPAPNVPSVPAVQPPLPIQAAPPVQHTPAPVQQPSPPIQPAAIIQPQTAQQAPNPYFAQPYYGGNSPFYGGQPYFGAQPFFGTQQNPLPAEPALNKQDNEPRDLLIHNQAIIEEVKKAAIEEAKKTAEEMIKRASEEAERLRQLARNEAESIVRDRRAEIRAEERLHEEMLGELKDKYSKYSEFFSRMVEGVKTIESDVDPMLKKNESTVSAPEALDTGLQPGLETAYSNYGFGKTY